MEKTTDNLFVVFGGLIFIAWLLDFGGGLSSAVTVFLTLFAILVAVNGLSRGELRAKKRK
jgi:hypothetical protein